eukprot:CAMPEP_0175058018 /NCGR_PEP_ID=MMETSP0052_2-20121109/11601_1 /TAXON_ID=51329 ORGANISM="Polytomella parva, Strain SAG 63-3" /NCGR_SAMPLE_ID=MMETSP0052_2 /ASSEMBLY_ACC=CAM_ASM_000194 /LENGTH=383 /DNA_ID=CAMNT_0016323325 /DNA_START=16 /DNA_END=1164 /DNA_ORIENTATION=+
MAEQMPHGVPQALLQSGIPQADDRSSLLKELEQDIVKATRKTIEFLNVGLHLLQIKNEGLYKDAGFKTIRQYVEHNKALFNITGRHADRLIACAKYVLELPEGTEKPTSLRQVLPLLNKRQRKSRKPQNPGEESSDQGEDPDGTKGRGRYRVGAKRSHANMVGGSMNLVGLPLGQGHVDPSQLAHLGVHHPHVPGIPAALPGNLAHPGLGASVAGALPVAGAPATGLPPGPVLMSSLTGEPDLSNDAASGLMMMVGENGHMTMIPPNQVGLMDASHADRSDASKHHSLPPRKRLHRSGVDDAGGGGEGLDEAGLNTTDGVVNHGGVPPHSSGISQMLGVGDIVDGYPPGYDAGPFMTNAHLGQMLSAIYGNNSGQGIIGGAHH